jgi:hypothetical protein
VSHYSTGDLSESQESSSDSDSEGDSSSNSSSGSEIESENEFDDRPAEKKRKTDNSQHSRKGESPPICKINKQT